MFKIFPINDNKTIEFWTIIDGVERFAPVQPAKNFIPKWFKQCPSKFTDDIAVKGTVKSCPAMHDWFNLGFVIPMWCDSILSCNRHEVEAQGGSPDDWEWNWKVSGSAYTWAVHGNQQFLDYAPSWVNQTTSHMFKAECPWRCKTPKGYSLIQFPMFWEFNRDWTVIPGIIDTDIHHELNQQVMIHKEQVTIKRGVPLAMYVPIKRETLNYDVRAATEEDLKVSRSNTHEIFSKFKGAYNISRR